ncbi:MAG: hypothetical protein L0211_10560, partial [Planctomycetaceae bacterium]|nr:hypothetical protein [Planctomycetaceae bacterium]
SARSASGSASENLNVADPPPLAERADHSAQIAALYRLVLARAPATDELAIGTQFLAAASSESPDSMKLTPIEQYAQLLLLMNEVMYID